MQGMWLCQALDLDDKYLAQGLLFAEDARVRAAAVRFYSDRADPNSDTKWPVDQDTALGILKVTVNDPDARVRLEAVRALGKFAATDAATAAAVIALDSLNHPRDRFLDFALYLTVNELAEPLMAAIEQGDWKLDSEQVEFVLTSIEPMRASQYLSKHLTTTGIAKDGSGPWIGLIGKSGGPNELRMLYDQVKSGGFDNAASVRAIDALIEANRLRKLRPAGGPAGIDSLFAAEDAAVRTAATRLAGAWRLGGQIGNLMKIASTKDENDSVRHSAINALRAIGGGGAAAELKKLTSEDYSLSIRKKAVGALAAIAPDDAVQPFFAILPGIQSEAEGLDLWRGMLSGKDAGKKLVENLPSELSTIAAMAGVRVAREGGRNEPELVAALMPYAGIAMEAKELTPARMKELIGLVASQGDPHRGELVYRRAELACITCHAIGGVGGKVGPDMTSLGASAPIDYIIQSLYDPNAKIKENYHSMIVATEDGQTFTGIQVSSTDEELVIRDATGKLIRIPADEVIASKNGKSLMPTGVIDRLNEQDQVDLISFISKLGKPGDFDAGKGGVAGLRNLGWHAPGRAARCRTDHQRRADRRLDAAVVTGQRQLTRQAAERNDHAKFQYFAGQRLRADRGRSVSRWAGHVQHRRRGQSILVGRRQTGRRDNRIQS